MKARASLISESNGSRVKASRYMVAMRLGASAVLSARTRLAQRSACPRTNGSFKRMSAWAGTLETVRRPIVENGDGVSKASIIGERKFRRMET